MQRAMTLRNHYHLAVPCALFWTANTLSAQQLRGVVRDSASREPIPGVVLSLVDAAGKVSGRTIADQQGRYHLPLAGAATRLQAVRIGFSPREVTVPPHAGSDNAAVDVAMVVLPTLMDAVLVSGETSCPPSPDASQALGLWSQVRSGLLATVVARQTNPPDVRTLIYTRDLDRVGERILAQSIRTQTGESARPFVASRDASALAAHGYMNEDSTGRTFGGPDADVLIDDSFFATHCFHIHPDDAQHRGQVGLSFVPTSGRDTMVDVSGVIWIDRAVPALRTLEFLYTGLEPAARAAGSGGTLVFRTMPNGLTFIEHWNIRWAKLAKAPRNVGLRSQTYDLVVDKIEESGGQLVSASWAAGDQWKATLGEVRGRVVAQGTGRGLPNVRIWIDGTDDQRRTDTTGAFTLHDLLPGPYTLKATDSSLVQFGITDAAQATLDLERGKPADVTLSMRGPEEQLTDLCHGDRITDSTALLTGIVVAGADATVVTDAVLEVSWQDAAERPMLKRASPGEKGRFIVCGVPRDRPLTITVRRPGGRVSTSSARVARDRYLELVAIPVP
jgi:hypothetical protein